jgi:MoaA/NifB/PqqE/SkfB family radical SAM enzyme
MGRADLEPVWVERAVARDPRLVGIVAESATRFFEDGAHETARDLLVVLSRLAPEDPGILNGLGVVRLALGDAAGAESALREALRIEPAHDEARRSLAHLLRTTGRDAGARGLEDDAPAEEAAVVEAAPPEIRIESRVARGTERELVIHVRNPGPARDVVLSVDVYPKVEPGHPDRHLGYWNHPMTLPAGAETAVEVRWDLPDDAVTFDGTPAATSWRGPLREDGEHVLTALVYEDEQPVARAHLETWIGSPRLKSAIWFMTYRCNMRCSYCWEVQRIAKGELKPDPFRPAEECAAAWNRLVPGILDLTGGEPFLQPDFLGFLDALDDRIRVAVTTNLSFDMTDFVQRVTPEKVFSMTLSLHPTQKLSLDTFLGRALLLKNRGFRLTVNYVAWPEQLWLIPRFKDAVEEAGLRFHVDPYAATPHRPYQFTEEELAFLRRFVGSDREKHWYGEVDRSPVLCSGGFEHLNVQPNGEAFRCIGDKVWNKPSLGNIFDEGFALNDDWTRCGDYWRCPACDKDKIRVETIETGGAVSPS